MGDKTGIAWTDATKACSECEQVKPRAAFFSDRTRADGLSYRCRDCRNRTARAKYVRRGRPTRSGPLPAPARDGDKRQARARVNHLVATAKLVPPGDLKCVDCGHRGPDRRHEYDHHLGYAPEHHLDVEPLCSTCHRKRAIARGEWRRG